ncbi:MAG: helicase HerA domain-containing protein, partial [Candidatus Thorarchaeota archaeon]
MEIASIKGSNVTLLYHSTDTVADVGQQFSIMELPEQTEGLIVQIIRTESVEYPGIQQEMIQDILEQRLAESETMIDHEHGMNEIKSLKFALAKIRKRVRSRNWETWDGWIPTRNVEINQIDANTLIENILPSSEHELSSFVKFNNTPINFDGPRLNMVNVLTGVKGSGKSHTAKHLVIALSSLRVPCIIFDINGEYVELPNAQVLNWGENFFPDLAEFGYEMLNEIVQALRPMTENTRAVFELGLPNRFSTRQANCQRRQVPFTISIS